RILDPHAAIAVDAAAVLARTAEPDPDLLQPRLGRVEVARGQAEMIDAGALGPRHHLVRRPAGEELEIDALAHLEIDDPRLAPVVEEPQDLGEAELLIEGERGVEVPHLDGDVAETRKDAHGSCFLSLSAAVQ